MVLANVRHHAEPQMVPGMIQNYQVIFARRRAEAAADRLSEQNAAPGRLGVNDATHVRVESGRQHANIAEDLRLAGFEPAENALAVLSGSFPV
jgi:hypothetical protein